MSLLLIIKEVFPNTPREDINRFVDLESKLLNSGINTQNRLAGFISQIGHESGGFSKLEENLNYSAKRIMEVFPSKFDLATVKEYEYNPRKFASRSYANRMGNGPESSGDGYKYRGRGLIQLTGKNNYIQFGKSIGYDIESNPDYVSTPKGAIDSAIWYWNTNNCNAAADVRNNTLLTKKINGGNHGLSERIKLEALAWNKLKNYDKNISLDPMINEDHQTIAISPQKQPSLLDIFKKLFAKK